MIYYFKGFDQFISVYKLKSANKKRTKTLVHVNLSWKTRMCNRKHGTEVQDKEVMIEVFDPPIWPSMDTTWTYPISRDWT